MRRNWAPSAAWGAGSVSRRGQGSRARAGGSVPCVRGLRAARPRGSSPLLSQQGNGGGR